MIRKAACAAMLVLALVFASLALCPEPTDASDTESETWFVTPDGLYEYSIQSGKFPEPGQTDSSGEPVPGSTFEYSTTYTSFSYSEEYKVWDRNTGQLVNEYEVNYVMEHRTRSSTSATTARANVVGVEGNDQEFPIVIHVGDFADTFKTYLEQFSEYQYKSISVTRSIQDGVFSGLQSSVIYLITGNLTIEEQTVNDECVGLNGNTLIVSCSGNLTIDGENATDLWSEVRLYITDSAGVVFKSNLKAYVTLVEADENIQFGTSNSVSAGKFRVGTSVLKTGLVVFVNTDLYESANSGLSINVIPISDEVSFLETKNGYIYSGPRDVTEITVPGYVTTIGKDAFILLDCLESVTFPNTVESIGESAFDGCSNLTTVTFESGGTADLTLGTYAFSGTSIEAIELPARTVSVYYSFINCNSLREITFEESTEYRLQTFTNVDSLSSLYKLHIPVPSDGSFPLFSSTVTDLKILLLDSDSSIKEDEHGILYRTESDGSLTILFIPTDVSGEVTIPEGVKTIGERAFYEKDVTVLNLPASLESIGNRAFARTSLTELNVAEGSKLNAIYNFAFSETNLQDVDLSGCSELVTIGSYAFSYSKLSSIKLPDTVKTIQMGAFSGTNLSEITLPQSLESLPIEVLTGTKITELHLPGSLKSIGYDSLPKTITTITVDEGSEYYKVVDGILYSISSGMELVYIPYNITHLVIPSDVTSIRNEVAASHTNLQSVVFEEGCTADISNSMFMGCTSLTSIDASNAKFESIGRQAFYGATSLSEVKVPSTLKYIGDYAFKGCSDLTALDLSGTQYTGTRSSSSTVSSTDLLAESGVTHLSLPATITRLPGLSSCSNLEWIRIDSDCTTYTSYDDKIIVRYDGSLSYVVPVIHADENGLRTLTIPSSVTTIRASTLGYKTLDALYVDPENTAFISVSDNKAILTSDGTVLICIVNTAEEVTIPDSVTTINIDVLNYASSLKRLQWGGDTTSSDLSIFLSSESLTEVVLQTSGNVALTGVNVPHVESLSISCNTLVVSMSSAMKGNTDGYILNLDVDSISGSEFIGNGISQLHISGNLASSNAFGQYFADGVYEIGIWVNGEEVDTLAALSGFGLTLSSSIADLSVEVETVEKNGTEWTIYLLIHSPEYEPYDLDAKSDGTLLSLIDGRFVVTLDSSISIEVTVKEESDQYHTVVFNATGGSFETSTNILLIGHGRTILASQLSSMTPSKEGYEFKGWYIDSKLSTPYSRTPVVSDMELYARWEPVEGHVVELDDKYGRVTVTYEDGRVFYSGDRVEPGTDLVFEFEAGNGLELLGWSVVGDSGTVPYGSGKLVLTIEEAVDVAAEVRVFSTSNALINITDLPTPEGENIELVWSIQYEVDTSMSTWRGMPSIPVIVDDYVYVRASDTLYKLSIYTGEVIKYITTENTTSTAYYHYLGYGGGVIVDYMTGIAYDLDLNKLYDLPKSFTAVYYEGGYFYGLSQSGLWKFDALTGNITTAGAWANGVSVKWFGMYGTTSTPVFNNGWVYFLEVDGDSRYIAGVNLESGQKVTVLFEEMEGYLCDDGWLTLYEYDGVDYLFLTGYTGGLFDLSGNGSIVECVKLNSDGSFDKESLRWMKFDVSGSTSALVVVDGRGYLNITLMDGDRDDITGGGVFYVIDVDAFLDTPQSLWSNYASYVDEDLTYTSRVIGESNVGGWVIYYESSIATHGSIVVSTAYKNDTGNVYIYLLPYTASEQALYTFTDWEGKTQATGYLKSSPVGANYGSQAVRVGPNGELIWYTDSGTIWCVRGISGMPFQFLIQDSEGAVWVESNGGSVSDALLNALNELYGGSKTVSDTGGITVNGIAPSIYLNGQGTWVSIDISDNKYSAYRTFFVSLTITTNIGDPLDLNEAYNSGIYYLQEGNTVTEYRLPDILDSTSKDGYFTKTAYFTVSVDAGNGSEVESEVVQSGDAFVLPKAPALTNYEFVGWEIDGVVYGAGTEITIVKDTDVVAVWAWADESERVAGVGISSTADGFVEEPQPGKWVAISGAGYGETADAAVAAIGNYISSAPGDVAEKTLFIVFAQTGTSASDMIQGRLYNSDGKLIYTENLIPSNSLWYVTLSSDVPNSNNSEKLGEYYVADGRYTMAVYVNGSMMCSVEISLSDGSYSNVTLKGAAMNASEGDSFGLSPEFFVLEDGAYTAGNVAQTGVTWSSSDESVVSIDPSTGEAVALSAGTAVITVTTKDGGYKAYCYVTVEATPVKSVVFEDGSAQTIVIGEELQLLVDYGGASATVTWRSSAPLVANVDSEGKVTALSAGTAVITVTVRDSLGNTVTADCVITVSAKAVESVTVSRSSMSLSVGGSAMLEATVSPTDATDDRVVWSSSNPSVATVDSNGTVTALSAGTAIITATAADGSGFQASCTVTVSNVAVESVSLSSTFATLEVGGSTILTATVSPDNAQNREVVWASSNSTVATVSNGVVTAVGPGTAVITVSTVDGGKTATCTVTVKGQIEGITLDLTSASLEVGSSVTLQYTLSPEGTGGYTVSWSTSDSGVATVSNGVVTAVGPGTAVITASVGGTQLSAVCTVTVIGSPTVVDTSSVVNADGSVTTTVVEEIEAGDGMTIEKVTETTTSGGATSSTTTYTIGTEGSDVRTSVIIETDAGGNSTVVAETTVPSTTVNGVKSASAADIRSAIEQMDTASTLTGLDVASIATVNMDTGADVVDVVATIPSDGMDSLMETGVSLRTDIGTVEFDASVIGTMSDLGGDARISISRLLGSSVPSALDGMEGVAAYDVSLTVGGRSVSQLGGTVTLKFHYQLEDGQTSAGVKVYHIADDGTMTMCYSSYDASTSTVTVTTDHFSTFAVVYDLSEQSGSGAVSGSDPGSGSPLLYVCLGAMAAIIVMMALFMFMMMRNNRTPKA